MSQRYVCPGSSAIEKRRAAKLDGFTLVELLLVVAIVLILFGIVVPAYNRAKVRAWVTDDVMKLKQLGVANSLYSSENDGRIQVSLRYHIANQERSLFSSKLDPTREGLWNALAERYGYKTRTFDQRVSFVGLHEMQGSSVEPNQFATLPGSPGWLIAFSPPEIERSDVDTVFQGNFLRLTFEGSVVRRSPQRYGNATAYIWYFRDHTDEEKQALLEE